jgi:hypothetical protein
MPLAGWLINNTNTNGGIFVNTKLQKIISEIDRTRQKISELQALIPKLEKQKTELENAEIIKSFRSINITPAEFADFVKAYKDGELPAPADFGEISLEEDINDEEGY